MLCFYRVACWSLKIALIPFHNVFSVYSWLIIVFLSFYYLDSSSHLILAIVLPSLVFFVDWTLQCFSEVLTYVTEKTGKTDPISWLVEVALKFRLGFVS